MERSSELDAKRKEAQKAILALKAQTASMAILDLFGKAFKGQGGSQGLGYWLSNIVIMNLLMLGPWVLIGRALNEFDQTKDVWVSAVILVEMIIAGIAVGYTAIQDLFRILAFVVIEKIDNVTDLSALVNWLRSSWSIRNVSAFILVIAVIAFYGAFVRFGVNNGYFLGFGFMFSVIITGLFAGLGFYVTFWVALLSSNLGSYQYEVDSFFSADSEIVRSISQTLTRNVYILAAYFAVFTLLWSSRIINQEFSATLTAPFLLISWSVITAQFILTHRTLGRIVNGTKMKTLGRIRSRIDSLQAKGDLAEKGTAESILRLMDMYERAKTVRVDTFGIHSFSAFFIQLMLPLAGLVLGNLDYVHILEQIRLIFNR